MPIRHAAELHAFHTVVRAGSISAGARELGLSQPTVSAHITKLESRYGVELFFRQGRRIHLTDFGRQLLEPVRRLVDAEFEAVSLLMNARAGGQGHLRLCAVGPYNVTPMLHAFRHAHPGVRITMAVGDSQQIVQSVLDYEADVGILVHDATDPHLLSLPYRRQPLVFFVAVGHPLAAKSDLTLKHLQGQPFVLREEGSTTRRVLEQVLAKEGVTVRGDLVIGSREAVREAVAQGLGIGVVADSAYVEDARTKRLQIHCDELCTHVHVVCRRERKDARLIAAFLEIVRSKRSKE